MRMLFCNIGWMNRYCGDPRDQIRGGGAWVDEHGWGLEIFNFLPYRGTMYGYVQTPGTNETIRLERLGASPEDDRTDGILAVWVAKSPDGGVYIVGWYKDATVYREYQDEVKDCRRVHSGGTVGFNVRADAAKCRCLPPDARTFQIPTNTKGFLGRSHIWYADSEEAREFRQQVIDYINSDGSPRLSSANAPVFHRAHQPDPFRRQKIERVAVEMVTRYYKAMGYVVDSVEEDNVGWDLEACSNGRLLLLEVKGLSGSQVQAELTPNEYSQMQRNRDKYRVCVVTDALSDPQLRVFSYSRLADSWEDEAGNPLQIKEITAVSVRLLAAQ